LLFGWFWPGNPKHEAAQKGVDISLAGEAWIDFASGIYPTKIDYRHPGVTANQHLPFFQNGETCLS
jgi:hypothetical protein